MSDYSMNYVTRVIRDMTYLVKECIGGEDPPFIESSLIEEGTFGDEMHLAEIRIQNYLCQEWVNTHRPSDSLCSVSAKFEGEGDQRILWDSSCTGRYVLLEVIRQEGQEPTVTLEWDSGTGAVSSLMYRIFGMTIPGVKTVPKGKVRISEFGGITWVEGTPTWERARVY